MSHSLRVFIIVVAVFVSYFYMRERTGVHITVVIADLLNKLFGSLRKSSQHQTLKTEREFGRMSNAQRSKSIKYRYYEFINDLLIALRFREYGVTVEGLTIVALLATLIISILTQAVMPGFIMFILMFCCVYVTIVAALYIVSRIGAQERKKDSIATIDILCSVMQDGALIAIETSLTLIPKSVRPYFEKFVRNVNNLNYSVEDALISLNNDMGTIFDEFCETAIQYERDRTPGMEMLFTFIVSDNAKMSARDVKLRRAMDAANRDFFSSCLLMLGMLGYTVVTYDYVRELYTTTFGHFMLMIYFVGGLITFILMQYILGKRYKYKEK